MALISIHHFILKQLTLFFSILSIFVVGAFYHHMFNILAMAKTRFVF